MFQLIQNQLRGEENVRTDTLWIMLLKQVYE